VSLNHTRSRDAEHIRIPHIEGSETMPACPSWVGGRRTGRGVQPRPLYVGQGDPALLAGVTSRAVHGNGPLCGDGGIYGATRRRHQHELYQRQRALRNTLGRGSMEVRQRDTRAIMLTSAASSDGSVETVQCEPEGAANADL
jgi:hypothetical protein